MFNRFHIKQLQQSFWEDWNFKQYEDLQNKEVTERFHGSGMIKDTSGQHDIEVYYECVADIDIINDDASINRIYYYDIKVHCYVDWNRHFNGDPLPEYYLNALEELELGPGSEDWDGRRAFYYESFQVELKGVTIYDDYYKKTAISYLLKKASNLEPRKKPYILEDHEGRPWKVTIYNNMRGKDFLMEPMESSWGIHGNSMEPMGIHGNSMSAEFITDKQKADIMKSTFRTILQTMIASGGDFLENSYQQSILDAMRAAEENMLKALEDKKAKAALESMNKQMQEILGERPTGNKQYIAEDVLRRAQEKAMNAAEAQFKPEGVIQSKLEAGKTAVRMGEKKAGRAAALKMAGKALDAYNYGLILYDITVAFAEVTKGNSQAVDKGMGAFVDLGVSLVSTMAAAGAGAAAGAAWGASTGTAVGLAVGVVLGTMWGVANYICLKVTGKSLSEYLGGKINAAIDRYVAPAVQPLADDILRQQSGGLIDTRGFNPNNNFFGY